MGCPYMIYLSNKAIDWNFESIAWHNKICEQSNFRSNEVTVSDQVLNYAIVWGFPANYFTIRLEDKQEQSEKLNIVDNKTLKLCTIF